MSSTLKSLRALSDPTRLRIVALLEKDELSVNELQEITRLGQSRISTHLGLLSDCGLVQSRREGKRTFYKLNQHADTVAGEFIQLAIRGAKELAEHGSDQSISNAFSPAGGNRRRFISTRSPGDSIASMARAARGRCSDISCSGFCHKSRWRISVRAKAC